MANQPRNRFGMASSVPPLDSGLSRNAIGDERATSAPLMDLTGYPSSDALTQSPIQQDSPVEAKPDICMLDALLEEATGHTSLAAKKRKAETLFVQSDDGEIAATDSVGDISDSDDESDSRGWGSRHVYEPLNEPMPNEAIYHTSFPKAEQKATAIVEAFQHEVRNSEYQGTELRTLLEKMQKCEKPEYPKSIHVGIIGDAGMGKSSLLNNLLHEDALAAVGDEGASQTLVVQEFHLAPQDQERRYRAEVVLFEREQCHQVVRDILELYYNYIRNYGGADLDPDDRGEEEDDAFEDVDTAIEVMLALFADHAEIADFHTTTAFLKKNDTPDQDKFFEQLDIWVDELLSSVKFKAGTFILEADTPVELAHALRRFTERPKRQRTIDIASAEARMPSLWPIVETVKTYVRSDSVILKQGIILVDLPGVSDTNKARVQKTYDSLKACDYRIVVGQISRAVTDRTIKKKLRDGFHDTGTRTLIMVCTHADKRSSKAAKNMEYSETQLEKAEKLTKKIDEIKTELERMSGQAKRASKSERKKLVEKKKCLKTQQNHEERLLKQVQILSRNENVTSQLQEKYSQWTGDMQPLRVFCVSNLIYNEYRHGFRQDKAPSLSVENTGIPNLRQWILRLPAQQKLKAFKNYCEIALPGLLNSIRLESTVTKYQKKEQVKAFLSEGRKHTIGIISRAATKFRSSTIEEIHRKITTHETGWFDEGKDIATNFERIRWNTYLAHCRRSGTFQSQGKPELSWTHRLLEPVRRDLGSAFAEQQTACWTWQQELIDDLMERIDKTRDKVKDDPAVMGGVLRYFFDNVELHKKGLEKHIGSICESMRTGLRDVADRALIDNPHTYLKKGLEPTFHKCLTYSGIGSHLLRKNAFLSGVVNKKESFKDIKKHVRPAQRNHVEKHKRQLDAAVNAMFTDLEHDLDHMCNDPNVEAKGMALRKTLLAMVQQANNVLEDEVKNLLRECETFV